MLIDKRIITFLTKQLVYSRILLIVFQFLINKIMNDYPTDAFQGVPPEKGYFFY